METNNIEMNKSPANQAKELFPSKIRYEKLYQLLMDTIPSSVLLIDPQFRILVANRNFLEKILRTEKDVIGRPLDAVFPSVIMKDMGLENLIKKVFQTNSPLRGGRLTYRAPGVPIRIYYYSLMPVSLESNIENVMIIMNDVTELLRLSEEVSQVERHLASIVESVNDIIISTDGNGNIISWNHAAEKATGYALQQVENRHFFDFLIPGHSIKMEALFAQLKTSKDVRQEEYSLVTRTKQIIPVSWVCSTMRNDAGKIMGFVVVGRDLTEQRKLEAQILQSQKLSALGIMAGGIAHEIRNPLAVASSAAQFLLEDDISPDFIKECCSKIINSIQKASVIIENLLRFARPSTPKNVERIDINGLVLETLQLTSNQAKLQKITTQVHIPDTSILVNGIANMLQQLIMNLVINAFKAMPNGGKLEVAVSREADSAVVRVIDTGCGIPAEVLDKIFDPFYTTSQVGDGTGLGLSLCYSIVKQHFGAIEVESTEGKGSVFTVQLPLA